MKTVRTIKIHAQEIKKDKQKFIACSAQIRGSWYKIKFTKDCDGVPKERGLYDLVIDFDECSFENGKSYENKKGDRIKSNDIIWVKHIVGLNKYSEEKLKEENRTTFEEIFGEDDE